MDDDEAEKVAALTAEAKRAPWVWVLCADQHHEKEFCEQSDVGWWADLAEDNKLPQVIVGTGKFGCTRFHGKMVKLFVSVIPDGQTVAAHIDHICRGPAWHNTLVPRFCFLVGSCIRDPAHVRQGDVVVATSALLPGAPDAPDYVHADSDMLRFATPPDAWWAPAETMTDAELEEKFLVYLFLRSTAAEEWMLREFDSWLKENDLKMNGIYMRGCFEGMELTHLFETKRIEMPVDGGLQLAPHETDRLRREIKLSGNFLETREAFEPKVCKGVFANGMSEDQLGPAQQRDHRVVALDHDSAEYYLSMRAHGMPHALSIKDTDAAHRCYSVALVLALLPLFFA